MHYSSYKWEWIEVGEKYLSEGMGKLFVAKSGSVRSSQLLTTTGNRSGLPNKN
jgi:hypothetical protein